MTARTLITTLQDIQKKAGDRDIMIDIELDSSYAGLEEVSWVESGGTPLIITLSNRSIAQETIEN